MGTSYDAIYFYGCVVTPDGDMDDIDNMICDALKIERRGGEDYGEWIDRRNRAWIQAFGCVFDNTYLGHPGRDDSPWAVYPTEAHRWSWESMDVPHWTPAQIEHWRVCCERLRALVPMLSAPGLRFDVRAG